MSFQSNRKQSLTIFGQDLSLVWAVWENLRSWFVRTFIPMYLPRLVPPCPYEERIKNNNDNENNTRCILISRPGGMEQLRFLRLRRDIVTCGYNLLEGGPFVSVDDLPDDCVAVSIHAFSVNYADCCIRWGLYDSAKEKVGYPICPGFDIAGIVERVGSSCSSSSSLAVGDAVFGCTLFGAYSTRAMIPALHLRKIPLSIPTMSMSQAAAIPAVALTALYALFLAGHFPSSTPQFTNRSILIHSAAGGVGSMLIQMSKILGLHPIVGVVGRSSKVHTAKALGCTHVIDKSTCRNNPAELWHQIRQAGPPQGFATVMESNGIDTLAQSYEHLAMTGRVIVYGFHTNLPMGRDMLSPWQWIQMARKKANMPLFDAMEMGRNNKAILAFNLSFFAQERELLAQLFDSIVTWLAAGEIVCPTVTTYPMEQIAQAHEFIQSGTSVGKIVITTNTKE